MSRIHVSRYHSSAFFCTPFTIGECVVVRRTLFASMNGDTGNDWSQWYSSANRARGSTQSTESRLSNGPNPSLFQPPRNQPAHSNSGRKHSCGSYKVERLINKNLETSAREFIAGLKRANAASVHREQTRPKVDSSKEALEKSVWDQFLHSDQQSTARWPVISRPVDAAVFERIDDFQALGEEDEYGAKAGRITLFFLCLVRICDDTRFRVSLQIGQITASRKVAPLCVGDA